MFATTQTEVVGGVGAVTGLGSLGLIVWVVKAALAREDKKAKEKEESDNRKAKEHATIESKIREEFMQSLRESREDFRGSLKEAIGDLTSAFQSQQTQAHNFFREQSDAFKEIFRDIGGEIKSFRSEMKDVKEELRSVKDMIVYHDANVRQHNPEIPGSTQGMVDGSKKTNQEKK